MLSMKDSFTQVLELFAAMSPYLLFGFLVAGILHAFVPRVLYVRYLSGNNMRSVLLAALMGVPLPLCSCGVIPTAMSMRREGASHASTVSFLIATPQTGVDSIAATASLLGLPFAILRPCAAFVTALFGGGLTALLSDKSTQSEPQSAMPKEYKGFWDRVVGAIKYGFSDMIQDVGKWLVIGLAIAGAITIFVPDGAFTTFADSPIVNMLIVLAISAPMYLCATGSVPIAAALILKGLSPGAAFVLLMAGPATNMAAMMVIGKVLGKKTLFIYLFSILCGAVGFGLAIDTLMPMSWFTLSEVGRISSDCCDSGLSVVEMVSSVIFGGLLILAMINKYRKQNRTIMEKHYKVKGMMCNHCKTNVERALLAHPSVTSVDIDLTAGVVSVVGSIETEMVKRIITELGYEFVDE